MRAETPPTEQMTADVDSVVVRIVDELTGRLAGQSSPLVTDNAVSGELETQVRGILTRVFDRLGAADMPGSDPGRDAVITATAGAEIGRRRADQHIHPAESLAAANVLFEVALTAITELMPGRWATAAVALSVHHAIMENVVPAATSYVNVLLDRLSIAHSEERLRISRDLHDRVSHGIAVAHQRLQLSGLTEGGPDDDGAVSVRAALALLESTLRETQAIATELRYQVGSGLLSDAIADFVSDSDAGMTPIVVSNAGRVRRLPTGVQEETFIVVRELVHNARRHAAATTIHIDMSWRERSVQVTVRDDGRGFHRTDVRPGALGLIGSRERCDAIGAELSISSAPGSGTTVTLDIPLNPDVE
ncbi:sensor histidine kinase [Cryobacterium arcticum]|uniref:Histidine kinase domain-containing protein n=1 Tax=Cryobacterium arcticum TaxID=670052 RepID=A0A1B1BI58_9MICO|nr:ATP-binding protein [Cryobacterium arcticum]ANP72289.1 hypothetical protein PA27867_1327 [Cryobacterium arcticum]